MSPERNNKLQELSQTINRSIKYKLRLNNEIVQFLLTINPLSPTIKALIYRGSLAVMPFDEDSFRMLSERLFPSIQYINLMNKAISYFEDWFYYYHKALECIEYIPKTIISLGYITVSEAIIKRDEELAYELMKKSLDTLPIASATIRAGVSIKLSSIILVLRTHYKQNLHKVINVLLESDDISGISKVFSLVRIAILTASYDRELSKEILDLAIDQLEMVSIFRLFEAENLVTRGLIKIYRSNISELINLYPKLPSRGIKPWRYAIIYFIKQAKNKYNILQKLKIVSATEASIISNYLTQKKKTKETVESLIRRLLDR